MRMKKQPQLFISKSPRRSPWVGITIGIDLCDIWSHYCTLNGDGEVIDRGRFRTNTGGVAKRFRDIELALVAMETGTHSIWVSEQIKDLGHEVIVGNVRELRAISHSDRKSDKVDAEKIAGMRGLIRRSSGPSHIERPRASKRPVMPFFTNFDSWVNSNRSQTPYCARVLLGYVPEIQHRSISPPRSCYGCKPSFQMSCAGRG